MASYRHKMNHQIISGIIIILMLAALLLSSLYLTTETVHDCTGEECPVCMVLAQCEQILGRLGGNPASSAAYALIVVLAVSSAALYVQVRFFNTPVLNKVRLNN